MNRSTFYGLAGFCAALVVGFTLPPAAAQSTATVQLLPNMDNMKLRFGTGKIVDNKPQISPDLPAIAGPISGWTAIQWSPFPRATGNNMTINDPATADPQLGPAQYAFTAPDQRTHIWVYKAGANGHPVYDLFEQGGDVYGAGGRNLFLSTGVRGPATFDHTINFSMQAKISRAVVAYNTPAAEHNGAVLGMAFVGMAMNFPSPVDGSSSVLFLQIDVAKSSGKAKFKNICKISKSGRIILLAGGTLDGKPPLPFQVAGAPATISFSVNDYINRLFSQPVKCLMKGGGGMQEVALQGVKPAQISLKSVYIGLETQNGDKRPTAKVQGPQGDVQLGLQISNVHLTE